MAAVSAADRQIDAAGRIARSGETETDLSRREVEMLASCLKALAAWIGVVVVANDHRSGEPADRLAPIVDLFLPSAENLGYGRAVNLAVATLQSRGQLPPRN